MKELIDKGFLCHYRIIPINQPSYYDFENFISEDQVVTPSIRKELQKILDSYRKYSNNQSCIIFAPTIASCRLISDFFNTNEIPTSYVEGKNEPGYNKIIDKFRKKEIKVVVNCELLVQGIDLPMVQSIIVLRQTESIRLWIQMCGRVLRPWQGKSIALIIDHTNNHYIHGDPCDDRNWLMPNSYNKNLIKSVKNKSFKYDTIPQKIQTISKEKNLLLNIAENSLSNLNKLLSDIDYDTEFTDNYKIIKTNPQNNQSQKNTESLNNVLNNVSNNVSDNMLEIEKWSILDEKIIKDLPIYKIYEENGIKKVIKVLSLHEIPMNWKSIWSFLVYIREKKEYHKKWLVYTLFTLKAPLDVWQQLAIYLDYQMGWAYHCFRECHSPPTPSLAQNQSNQSLNQSSSSESKNKSGKQKKYFPKSPK
jgi:superfamily II DNA/RNA helicase